MCKKACKDCCGKCAKKIPVGEPIMAEDPLALDSALDMAAWIIYYSVSRVRRAHTTRSSQHFAELEMAVDDLKTAIDKLGACDPDRVEPLPEYLRRVAEILIARLEKARCQGCGHFGCDGGCVLPEEQI